ncbi:MAG: hypothetical protein HC822_11715 [Oscillochloris sp.]|nr:hypothetical protein [Oscillochloris sp.]
MSGIFGYLSTLRSPLQPEPATTMSRRMRHCDHMDLEWQAPHPAVQLGQRVVYTAQGTTLASAIATAGPVRLILSGELDHQEERRRELVTAGRIAPNADDAALALVVYLAGGAEALTDLEGSFTLAVWDGRSEQLWIVNDRFGLQQLIFAHHAGGFAFAPELKALLAAPGLPAELDEVAVAQYLRFQHLLGERTWARHCRVLPPASLLRYDLQTDTVHLRRYWDWEDLEEYPQIGFDDAVDEIIVRFQRVIDTQVRRAGRLGVFLSGGLDGRMITGFLPADTPVETFTFGAPGCRDVRYGRMLARRAGRPNHWHAFHSGNWVARNAPLHLALTEGQHSWIHSHGISMLPQARELIDVNLSGHDGGTVLGGHIRAYGKEDDKLRHPVSEQALYNDFALAFRDAFTWPGLLDHEADALRPDTWRLSYDSLVEQIRPTAYRPASMRADSVFLELSDRRHFGHQVTFQRAALAVRLPFYDYRLIHFVFGLPEAVRANPRLQRAILTRRAPKLALVPHDRYERLPHSDQRVVQAHDLLMRGRRWIGRRIGREAPHTLYADYEGYLRGELRPWAEKLLFDPRTQTRGLVNPRAVAALWRRAMQGEIWMIGKIAPLISLEFVMRYLFDGDDWRDLPIS